MSKKMGRDPFGDDDYGFIGDNKKNTEVTPKVNRKSEEEGNLIKRAYDLPRETVKRLGRMKTETLLSYNVIVRQAIEKHLKSNGF